MKLATRLFKCLVAITKVFTAQKHVPSGEFAALIRGVGDFITHLYDSFDRYNRTQDEQDQEGDDGDGAQR